MSSPRRQQIVQAATDSFALFGYKATTMDQVAKLANVGKGTIYTFFKNKEELFHEIVSQLIAEMKEAAEKVLAPELSITENIHRAVIAMLSFRKEHKLASQLFQEGQQVGTFIVQEGLERLEKELLDYLQQKLRLVYERHGVTPPNLELTAFVMLKLYNALVIDWEKRHSPLKAEEIAAVMEDYLFRGLIQQSEEE